MLMMLKIGVISDTHLNRVTDHFKREMERLFKDVKVIIHAGDMTSLAVYDYLSNWELKAVRGNMDDYELMITLPEKRIEVIGGKRIGIIHGRGAPYGIEDMIFREFAGADLDLIIFGHSHMPVNTLRQNVVMFNPGAFSVTSRGGGKVGLIEIDEDGMRPYHVPTHLSEI